MKTRDLLPWAALLGALACIPALALAQQAGPANQPIGILVMEVLPGSLAERAGF